MTPTKKKRGNPERDLVLKPIMARLKNDSDIIFWYRTASFQIGTLRMGCPGVPDLVVVVDCKREGRIALWFIETKAPNSPVKILAQLPYEQRTFAHTILGKPMTGFSIINDPAQYNAEKKRIQQL